MRNIGLIVSYDGTAYNGFQSQPKQNTVQDELQDAIRVLTGEEVKVIGSGRTDAGVHARGQVVNFITSSPIPADRWQLALNARLPEDIVVREAGEVPLDFHAIRAAKKKTYRYTINNSRVRDVFLHKYQYHHPTPLNLGEMMEAVRHIRGEHDYSSFCSRKSTKSSHVRTVFEAKIATENETFPDGEGRNGVFHIYVTGNGFLYNMVRIIVGTLIQIGEGKRASADMIKILYARDRSAAGPTAVAHGLCLWEVDYDVKFSK